MSRTLSRLKREGEISLKTPQQKWASSRDEGRISLFFSSCGRKLEVPLEIRQGALDLLMLPQESAESMRVVRGLSGFLSSRCRFLSPHQELRQQPQGSSPVLTWIWGSSEFSTRESGLISCGNMQVRFPLELEKHCQASSRVDIGIGGFLSR